VTADESDEHRQAVREARIKHATLRYNTLRLAIFVIALALLWLVRVRGLLLVALALLISGLASYVFLRGQRELMLAQISGGLERRRAKAAIRDAREDHLQPDELEEHELEQGPSQLTQSQSSHDADR
jgi:hypothetical protein